MNAKQLEEARQCLKDGNSLSKRTLTRWTPDWDTAATKFERAATLFKNCKQFDDSVLCYCKAGDAFYKSNSTYSAAKNYEAAGNVRRDEKRFTESTKFFEQAAQYYLEDGKPERASEVLMKAARSLEQNIKTSGKSSLGTTDDAAITQIINIYKKILDIFHNEGKFHMMPDPMRSYHSFLLKQNMIKEAIEGYTLAVEVYEALKQPHNVYKAYLSIIILHLANDDFASADDANSNFISKNPGFSRSEEGDVAAQLLSVFQNFSTEDLERAKKDSKLKFLDPQVFNVVKSLKITGDVKSLAARQRQVPTNSELANKKKTLFGEEDSGGAEDLEDGFDENGVPIKRDIDLTGADEEDLTGATQPAKSDTTNEQQPPAEEHNDIFDEEDLT
jgi:tetratricopeptide (TPR) repeat protein